MLRMRKLIVGAVLLLLGAAQAQTTRHELVANGEARQYYLHVPPGLSGAAPLVVALHGGGGSGLQMERSTRFSDLADKEMFLVAYPDGIDHQWNDGREEIGATSDDVGFLKAMIGDIEKQTTIDAKHIFVTGMSNGAAMTSRMACEASDVVRAIGVVSNTMKASMLDSCKPVRPIPVVEIHGVDDPVVPYEGGEIKILMRHRGKVISTRQYSEFWAKTNGCKPNPERKDLPQITDDGTSVIKDEFQKCEAPVVFYSIRGGGHAWPSGVGHIRIVNVGKTSYQINATKVIWTFFKDTIALDKQAEEEQAKAAAAKQATKKKKK